VDIETWIWLLLLSSKEEITCKQNLSSFYQKLVIIIFIALGEEFEKQDEDSFGFLNVLIDDKTKIRRKVQKCSHQKLKSCNFETAINQIMIRSRDFFW
jgi:hypothetical protein